MKKLLYLLLAVSLMLCSVAAPASARKVDKLDLTPSHFIYSESPEELVYDGLPKFAQYTSVLPADWTNIPAVISAAPENNTSVRYTYKGAVYFLYVRENSSEQLSVAVEPGVYQITLICAGDEYYNTANLTDDSWTFEIKKAALSITPPVPVEPLMEDGSAHALVTPGSVEALPGDEVKMVYSLSAEGPFSEEIPTASAPGTYKVYYTTKEHPFYETAEIGSCEVTITAAATPTPRPTATPSPVPAPLPETGDGTSLMALAVLAVVSCLCIFTCMRKNKRISE